MKSHAAELFSLQQKDRLDNEDKDRIKELKSKLSLTRIKKQPNVVPREVIELQSVDEALAKIKLKFNKEFTKELCETCPFSCEDTGNCKKPEHIVCYVKLEGQPF